MTDRETGPITIENPDLIAAILGQMSRDAAYTTNALLEGYRTDFYRAQATLAAIRHRMAELFSGDYMPAEHAIIRALHPSDELIQRFMPQEEVN